jgi:SAM-dependent methyltransferase
VVADMEAAAQRRPSTFTPPFDAEYERNRSDPRPGEPLYPHLSDLLQALRPRLKRARGVWLDLGSGTSPYRACMGDAELKSADIPASDDRVVRPDYVLEPGQPCPAPDASFDGILSTQVLEHVPDPREYLEDAFRLLRPGGEMILTTHGIWEDHACPLDLYRWTAQGLRQDVSSVGFEVVECLPLTCGVRAALQLLTHELTHVKWWGRYRGLTGWLLGALRLLARYRPQAMHAYADRALADERIGREGEHKLYIALLISARKPA